MNEQHPNQSHDRDTENDRDTGNDRDTENDRDTGNDRDTIDRPDMADAPLLIDCATCVARETDACGDCLVTFLCDVEPQAEAVVFDLDEIRAVRLLAKAGMVPTLRHRASS